MANSFHRPVVSIGWALPIVLQRVAQMLVQATINNNFRMNNVNFMVLSVVIASTVSVDNGDVEWCRKSHRERQQVIVRGAHRQAL